MRNYIVSVTTIVGSHQDGETFWTTEDTTPEDLMEETLERHFAQGWVGMTIMETDTLEVVDDEEGYTPGDVFWDTLRDCKDGETASGITRLALWEMGFALNREE